MTRFYGFHGQGATRGVIGKAMVAQAPFIRLQQECEIGTGPARGAQFIDGNIVEADGFQRPGEGACESGKRGNRS